ELTPFLVNLNPGRLNQGISFIFIKIYRIKILIKVAKSNIYIVLISYLYSFNIQKGRGLTDGYFALMGRAKMGDFLI
ncbi:MAG: hypothetical protein AABX55_00550, partial [Nanoarchaeota archaeon]